LHPPVRAREPAWLPREHQSISAPMNLPLFNFCASSRPRRFILDSNNESFFLEAIFLDYGAIVCKIITKIKQFVRK